MADAENREQHNHGSGTFVGGNVHGGIWHIFLPPYSKKPSSKQPPLLVVDVLAVVWWCLCQLDQRSSLVGTSPVRCGRRARRLRTA
ncbi:hypothetical protein [Streptomyces flaveus]|uniref:hypothetical protein n=1 Tax=Streptomyces flaveus TaxID=66370 RepID=UPI0033183949